MSEVNSLYPRVQKSASNGVAVGILVYAQVHQYPLAGGHYAQVGRGDGHVYLKDLIGRRVEARRLQVHPTPGGQSPVLPTGYYGCARSVGVGTRRIEHGPRRWQCSFRLMRIPHGGKRTQ